MGKDADVDAPCCEACKLFGGEAPARVEAPAAPLVVERAQVKLTWVEHGEPRELVPTGPEILVGRAKTNDVVLASGTISKRQCRFTFEDGQLAVHDTASACGTYLDGQRVRSAVVRDGSVVHVGDYALRITSTRAR